MFKGPKKINGVYAIVNLLDGTRYIGSSQCVETRSRAHRNMLLNGVHFNGPLQAAWDSCGARAFECVLLESVDGGEPERIAAEQRHLNATEKCYNRRISVEKNTDMDRPDVREWAPDKFRKFDDAQVSAIKAMRETGATYRVMAEHFKCSIATISFVINGKGVCYAG